MADILIAFAIFAGYMVIQYAKANAKKAIKRKVSSHSMSRAEAVAHVAPKPKKAMPAKADDDARLRKANKKAAAPMPEEGVRVSASKPQQAPKQAQPKQPAFANRDALKRAIIFGEILDRRF